MLLPLLLSIVILEFSDFNVATTSLLVKVLISYSIFTFVGTFIQSTFAVASPLLPASSTNSNVNSPFSVNVYVSFPLLFVIVTFSLGFKVTVTGSIVFSVLLYSNSAVGTSLSIQSTFAVAVPLFPLTSTNSNVNSPFSVNVYVSEPLLFSIVISVLGLTKVTTTSLFVIFLVLYSISAVGIDVVSLVLSSNRFIIAADAKIPYVSISSFTY